MKIEDCIKEPKIHGLVEDAGEENVEKKYVLSDKAEQTPAPALTIGRVFDT